MRFFLLLCIALIGVKTNAYYIGQGSNPNQVHQYMQQQQFATDAQYQQEQANSYQAGPANQVSISTLRDQFGKQWRVCEQIFTKVNEICSDTNSLDEENAKACIQGYQTAYNTCYRAMNVFAYQFA